MTMKTPHKIRMFGSEVDIECEWQGRYIKTVTALRGPDDCRRAVGIISKQLSDRTLIQQHHAITSMMDLLTWLMDLQDAKFAEDRGHAD